MLYLALAAAVWAALGILGYACMLHWRLGRDDLACLPAAACIGPIMWLALLASFIYDFR